MKTLVAFFVSAFVLLSTASYSQEQKSVFENAGLATAADGSSCVQLNWKKGAENTAYYLVERSADGKEFKQIALVFTAEDSQLVDYKFRDKGYASAGSAAYYRIIIVNDRHEITYLPVRKVAFATGTSSVTEGSTDALAGRK
ncbi:MAG TPA: hypothetical protein VFT06_12755 [Flavisolibacter sp.]|jgi:hypothetical protein|nr:hypothetical protein [Flavisolibacter sp.]